MEKEGVATSLAKNIKKTIKTTPRALSPSGIMKYDDILHNQGPEAASAYLRGDDLEENLNEVDFGKIKLPGQVNRFLNKFVQSMKDTKLNRMKRAAILYKVIDAAGMTPQQLMADIQKIKTAMKND